MTSDSLTQVELHALEEAARLETLAVKKLTFYEQAARDEELKQLCIQLRQQHQSNLAGIEQALADRPT